MKTEKNATIVGLKPTVNPKKVQVHFTQRIQRGKINALALANKSDERFSSGKSQHAWMQFELVDVKDLFSHHTQLMNDVESVVEHWDDLRSENQELPVGDVPAIAKYDGDTYPFSIQITETHTIRDNDQWSVENLNRALKQDGNGNYTVTEDNYGIIAYKDIVVGQPENTYISHAGFTDDLSEIKYRHNGFVLMGAQGEVVDEETSQPVIA